MEPDAMSSVRSIPGSGGGTGIAPIDPSRAPQTVRRAYRFFNVLCHGQPINRRTSLAMLASLIASATSSANLVTAALAAGAESSAAGNDPAAMRITRSGAQPSSTGPAEHFTGSVRLDPLFQAHPPSRAFGGLVTFEPGARTAWHTHPLGQILIVTVGVGWVQQWSGPVETIRPDDIVWIPPGQKHWHGATSTTGMTHIAIQEMHDEKVVAWMEHVTDARYRQ
jgi:quercetin dioxygenase-like cupin family protein